MKQATDNQTMELPMPGAKRGRGRPPTGTAMTNAQRQAAFKARKKANPAPQEKNDAWPWPAHREQLESALKAAQSKIEGLEKENALLVAERAAAFKIATQAQVEIGKLKAGKDNADKLASHALKLEAALHQVNADYDRMLADQGKPTESEKIKHLKECYDHERSLRIRADEKIQALESKAKSSRAKKNPTAII